MIKLKNNNKINMKKLTILFFSGLIIFLGSCVKQDFDKPPIGQLPIGKIYTISQLHQMFIDSGNFLINYDASVYATVTMDESSGNLYKSAYIQDSGYAVSLHFNQSGGLRVGDSIRLYLKGISLANYHEMFQLNNVKNDSNIVIIANQKYIQPKTVTISQLLAGQYIGQLIKLDSVQFSSSNLGNNWAEENSSVNRILEDCSDNKINVRTSNYANFANQPLPQGRGNLIAISSTYDGTPQLLIRTLDEVNLTGKRCSEGSGNIISPVEAVNETFESAADHTDIAIDGWTNIIVNGNRTWQGKIYKTQKYAQATGHNSNLDDMECWLITPPVKNQNGNKKLSFKSAMAYWKHSSGHKPLTILASTDFNGANFESATWTEITNVNLPIASNQNYEWVSSGTISLSNFVGNVSIAFKYKGSATESTSIELDDVAISSN